MSEKDTLQERALIQKAVRRNVRIDRIFSALGTIPLASYIASMPEPVTVDSLILAGFLGTLLVIVLFSSYWNFLRDLPPRLRSTILLFTTSMWITLTVGALSWVPAYIAAPAGTMLALHMAYLRSTTYRRYLMAMAALLESKVEARLMA